MPPPPGFEEIQRQELSLMFRRLAGLRLLFLPLALLLSLYVVVREPARWRVAFLLVLLVPLSAFFVAEAIRVRRTVVHPGAVAWNLAAAVVAQVGVSFATGALESPFVYTFVPLAVMIGLFTSRRAHVALAALQLAGVAALAGVELTRAVPDLNLLAFGGGPRAGHGDVHLIASAVVLATVLVLGSRAGRAVRGAFDKMLRRALRAQDESLRAHAERGEELTALSAEIAHELKNPLASVKGLAALLADGLPPGKPSERLGVLRREVDRMQGTLEEFLNFSRPMVPLAVGRVDLQALAREVAVLHEGMAHEHGVRIHVRGEPALARCDRRKVKQVLMNLVQNALDAAAGGGDLEIEVTVDGGEARVAVLDRGRGVDPALAARVFEAGVTSKARGSGLGLTIARALARQHGGDVDLRGRDGGGSAAVLRLPTDPRSEAGSTAGAAPHPLPVAATEDGAP